MHSLCTSAKKAVSDDMDCKYVKVDLSLKLWYAVGAAAADDDDDDEDESWSNTIPTDAPSLLSSCRRLSQSCSHLAVNNNTGLSSSSCCSIKFVS